MHFHQMFGDGQAETGTVMFTCHGAFDLHERFQGFADPVWRDTDTCVGNRDCQTSMIMNTCCHSDGAACFCELHRVG